MLLAAALLTGCVSGDTKDPGGRPHRDLAVRPESLPPLPPGALPSAAATSAAPGTSGSTTPRPPTGVASSAAGTTGPSATAAPSTPTGSAAPFRRVGETADRTNDTEGSGPPYADLVAVTIDDDGTNARVTVAFDGNVPARLPADETMGVGVDFFRSATQIESDYQLFADGQPEGWFAYLQTPGGKFVKYPGRFGVGGNRIEFVVPWSALGSPASGLFTAFADWTRDGGTLNNPFSEDHVPNLGKASFSR